MTRNDMNNIILSNMSAELKDQPGIVERVGMAFNNWFQSLVSMSRAPATQPADDSATAQPAA